MSHERMKPKSVRTIGEWWFRKRTLPWVILGIFTVFWFSFFALVSPQPAGPDVFVFRDAGCNWAHGRGLVAASVPTGNTITPLLFASYTPGALLLFGLAASLFGCSASVDTFYNLAFAAAAIFLLYRCFSLAVTSGRQRVCAALLLGAALPTGMVAFDSDRPEMPAFCLLAAILLLWRRTSSVATRSLLFARNGIVFLIHPFAGIAGWLLLAFLLLFDERTVEAHSRTGRLQVVVAGSALYALIVAVWALSMWSQDHTSLHRFLEHAAGRGTGAGVVLHGAKAADSESGSGAHNGYAVAFRQLFNPAFPASAAIAISLLVSGLVVSGLRLSRTRTATSPAPVCTSAVRAADLSPRRFSRTDKLPWTLSRAFAGRGFHRRISAGQCIARVHGAALSHPDCLRLHCPLGWIRYPANRRRS